MRTVILIVAGVVLCTETIWSQDEKKSPITSAEEYLTELEKVNTDFFGATAYLGDSFAFRLLREKAKRTLELDERLQKGVVSDVVRDGVFVGRFLDLVALGIADNYRHPISGEKTSPFPELPAMIKRHEETDLPIAQEASVTEILQIILRAKLTTWKEFERLRAGFNLHESWELTLKEESKSQPDVLPFLENIKLSDPSWQFHNRRALWPGASDTFPQLWHKFETRGPVPLDISTPIKISALNQKGTFFHGFELVNDSGEPLHIKVEASKGALGIAVGGLRAVDWEGGEDALTGGQITVPFFPQGNNRVRLHVVRTDVPDFERFKKPSSADIYIWTGEAEQLPDGRKQELTKIMIGEDGKVQ